MIKKTIIILISNLILINHIIPLCYCDSVYVENIDSIDIKIKYGDNLVKQSSDKRITLNRHPVKNENKIFLESEVINKELISSMNPDVTNKKYGCNYAFIISKRNGWALSSPYEKYGCSHSEGNYNKNSYTLVNNNNHAVYPAFSTTVPGSFAADSILGYLNKNETRIYTINAGYWETITIENNQIQTGFFDPFLNMYISCEDKLETINKDKIYTYNEDNSCNKEISNFIDRTIT